MQELQISCFVRSVATSSHHTVRLSRGHQSADFNALADLRKRADEAM